MKKTTNPAKPNKDKKSPLSKEALEAYEIFAKQYKNALKKLADN